MSREIEGGNKEMNEIDLPCVLSIQTGINEPRYVGMRGIRQVASVEIPTYGASDLGVDASAVGNAGREGETRWTTSCPRSAREPRCWKADREEIVDKLIELMKAKGGLQ